MKTYTLELTGTEISMLTTLTIQVANDCNRKLYEDDAIIYATALGLRSKVLHLWQESGETELLLERRDPLTGQPIR